MRARSSQRVEPMVNHQLQRWMLPPPGSLKCNLDETFFSQEMALSNAIQDFSNWKPYFPMVKEGEAMTLKSALLWLQTERGEGHH